MTYEYYCDNKKTIRKAVEGFFSAFEKDPRVGSAIFGLGFVRRVEELLQSAFHCSHAVALSSGTSGLQCALLASGIGQNVAVLLPDKCWGGVQAAILSTGAVPAYYTVSGNSMKLESTKRKPQACIAVRGKNDSFSSVVSYCKKMNILIIEDWCSSNVSLQKRPPIPQKGLIAVLSFGYGKQLQSYEGGALLTNNSTMYANAVRLCQHPIYQMARLASIQENINSFPLNYRIHPISAAILTSLLEQTIAKHQL